MRTDLQEWLNDPENEPEVLRRITKAAWFFVATLGRFIVSQRADVQRADREAGTVADSVVEIVYEDVEAEEDD